MKNPCCDRAWQEYSLIHKAAHKASFNRLLRSFRFAERFLGRFNIEDTDSLFAEVDQFGFRKIEGKNMVDAVWRG